MSLIQQQVKLRQQLQRVKELAREGEFKQAQAILDTLPDNPDVEKLRARVNKRLYVATGEMPALEEDKPVVDSHTVAEQAQEAIAQGTPVKKAMPRVPGYWTVKFFAVLLVGVGLFAGVIGVLIGILGIGIGGGTGIAIPLIVAGVPMFVSGSMMLLFVDIARNTFEMKYLLLLIAERE